jgi:hypothetical protein
MCFRRRTMQLGKPLFFASHQKLSIAIVVIHYMMNRNEYLFSHLVYHLVRARQRMLIKTPAQSLP